MHLYYQIGGLWQRGEISAVVTIYHQMVFLAPSYISNNLFKGHSDVKSQTRVGNMWI